MRQVALAVNRLTFVVVTYCFTVGQSWRSFDLPHQVGKWREP